jgi:pimeloyl-ACP methyl ester carboxylesterase
MKVRDSMGMNRVIHTIIRKIKETEMKKRMMYIGLVLLALVGIGIGVKSIREEHYPLDIQPSAQWEPFLSQLDIEREAFFVDSDGTSLEAELFIPNGGQEKKPAIVFSPGSGDALYQNYGYGLVETYLLDVFLDHDFAVLLVNKRGMGLSEGNYVKNSIEGRAADIYAAASSIMDHPQIDAENIGLVGHSQGGWVVSLVAAEHPDIAFFISLVGPTTSIEENASDNAYHIGLCQGMQGDELEAYIQKRKDLVQVSKRIGEITNFGMFGLDARIMGYDPTTALTTVQSPGLLVYAENDDQVTPSVSIDRLNEIFDNQVPSNIQVAVIDGASHAFRLVDDPCDSWVQPENQAQSVQLAEVLHSWLTELGY